MSMLRGVCLLFASVCLPSACLYAMASCWSSSSSSQDVFAPGLCYYGMLLPVMIPVGVALAYLNRIGLKFFIHN